MLGERASGILLHPTSLPGRFGIGDLGDAAYQFIDFLLLSGQKYWQVLPLGHTGYGDSPYQSFSAFAGNPLLLSLELLAKRKLITKDELDAMPVFPDDRVDFGQVIPAKLNVLRKAAKQFRRSMSEVEREEFHQFWLHNSWWLDDYALFIALKDHNKGAVWTQWSPELVKREPDALSHWSNTLHDAIEAIKTWQYFFVKQWSELKRYANRRGIQIIGDIPIYVAHDSVDVWANQHLFQLDEQGNPIVVAGVPPDYFSETGQLWGNPIYSWDVARDTGYSWWTARFRDTLRQVDVIRLDHFRGFEAYWQVPAGEETAINGEWIDGPGASLFDHLLHELGGELPIIAENLGVITDEVENLRKKYHLPGMAILQFAFGYDAECGDLPHNYTNDLVAYTGTHDNDTTVAWWQSTGENDSTRTKEDVEKEKAYAKAYLNTEGKEIQWDCIRALMASVASTVVFPMQDLLGLGGEARMNFPGRPSGNWQWRMKPGCLTKELQTKMLSLTELYGRAPRKAEK
ncbi:4-alpha-glucanotransferase [bacterium]|nr:4-alpha-glucanotransferase [bacterium]